MSTIKQKEFTIKITQDSIKEENLKIKKKSKLLKKLEFMQKVVLISLALPYAWVTMSYILAYLEKPNTLESLSGYVVTVPIAAIVGYITQNSVRSSSYNKMRSIIEKENNTSTTEDDMLKERESHGA